MNKDPEATLEPGLKGPEGLESGSAGDKTEKLPQARL